MVVVWSLCCGMAIRAILRSGLSGQTGMPKPEGCDRSTSFYFFTNSISFKSITAGIAGGN